MDLDFEKETVFSLKEKILLEFRVPIADQKLKHLNEELEGTSVNLCSLPMT